MKLTTARLKRLIKEELEAVMKEEHSDYDTAIQQMEHLMSQGADPSKAEQYPETRKAAFEVVTNADLSMDDKDAIAQALGIKGNFVNHMVYSLMNYAASRKDNDAAAAGVIKNNVQPMLQKAMQSIIENNPEKKSGFLANLRSKLPFEE